MPPSLNTSTRSYKAANYLSIFLAVISWLAYLIILLGDYPYYFIPFLILVGSICIAFYSRARRSFIISLFNPLAIMILYYCFLPTIRYIKGDPTIIYCGGDLYKFDKAEMLYIHSYDDDCELGDMMYICSDDLNNAITHFWVNVFGNPIDVVPDELEPEEIYQPGDL